MTYLLIVRFPGNKDPLWIIDEKGRVNFVSTEGQVTVIFGEGFASSISTSFPLLECDGLFSPHLIATSMERS